MLQKNKENRLFGKYGEAIGVIAGEIGEKNAYALPKLLKVVVNTGVGEIAKNKETLEATKKDLAQITGQAPSVQKARISVASFGVRSGQPVGLRVTLRGIKMYQFLDKLFSITLPRLRDFRGVSRKSFDNKGNYTLGIEDHVVFPDIDITKVTKPFGLEITIVTSAHDKKTAERLLELMGMPFEK